MTSSGLQPATLRLPLPCATFFYTKRNVEWKTMIAKLVQQRIRRPGFDSRQGQEVCIFSTASRPVLRPTQPAIQWVPGALSPGVKRPGREADHSLPSSAVSRKGGAKPPLPHMSSWRVRKISLFILLPGTKRARACSFDGETTHVDCSGACKCRQSCTMDAHWLQERVVLGS
jgi:hypothetical protein